jgi:hypothetical protein
MAGASEDELDRMERLLQEAMRDELQAQGPPQRGRCRHCGGEVVFLPDFFAAGAPSRWTHVESQDYRCRTTFAEPR